MSTRRWTRVTLLPDDGATVTFCYGNHRNIGEVSMTLEPDAEGVYCRFFSGYRVTRGDGGAKSTLIPEAQELALAAWRSGKREGQLAVALYDIARKIRKEEK